MRKHLLSTTLLFLTFIHWQNPRPFLALDTSFNVQETTNPSISIRLSEALTAYHKKNYQQAINLWKTLLDTPEVRRDPLLLGQLWNYISLGYQKLHHWNSASQSIQKSLEYLAPQSTTYINPAQQLHYAQSLTSQGQLHFELGDYDIAVEHWKQSEAIYRSLKDLVGIRGSLINQSLALVRGGFYRQACFKILESVDISSQCNFSDGEPLTELLAAFQHVKEPRFQAISLHIFSQVLLKLGEVDLAEATLNEALSIPFESSKILARLKSTQAHLAFTQYLSLKREEGRARTRRLAQNLQNDVLQQAANVQNVYEALINIKTPDLNQYQLQIDYFTFLIDYLAWLKENSLNHQATETILEQQLDDLQTLQPPITNHPLEQYTLIKHAEGLIALLSTNHIEPQSAQTQIKKLLHPITQTASPSSSFIKTRSYAQGQLGRLYEIQQQWPQAQQATEQALSTVSSNPSLSYSWQWQLGRILAAQGQTNEAIQIYEKALDSLQSIRKDLTSLKRDAQLSFRDQIEPSYREFVALLLNEQTVSTPKLAKAMLMIDRLQVNEVEDFLLQNCITDSLANLDSYLARQSPNSALIYTIIQDEHLSVIFKIPGSQEIKFHRVNQSKKKVSELLGNYRRLLETKEERILRKSKEQGKQLYEWLIHPFKAELEQQRIDTLVFILDGPLRDIPMATLFTGKNYLIQDYAIAITPGLQILDSNQTNPVRQEAIVAGASEGNFDLGLSALPAVKREVSQLQTIFTKSEILLDNEFSKESLTSSLESNSASIIHIATHGQFSSKPEETYIVTGHGERLNIEDFGQLLQKRTRTDSLALLFLSACQTLSGDRWAVLGMAGVAIKSGAQSTIASLWNADDEASAELVTRFYKNLMAQPGRTKAEALKLSQVEMIEESSYDLPVFWAPYVLMGNWK